MNKQTLFPAKLAGRCSDGNERGQGRKIHALKDWTQPSYHDIYGTALCKAEPGRRSVGWSPMEGEIITCPKCLRAIKSREALIQKE